MSKIKVIFFPDPLHETSTAVKAELSKSFGCYASTAVDEYQQVFHQSGKFAFCFSDPLVAVKFFVANNKDLGGLNFKSFVCLNKTGKYSEESLKILNLHKLTIYQKTESAKLIEDIQNYFSSADSIESIDDIEFIMPGDDDGTASED